MKKKMIALVMLIIMLTGCQNTANVNTTDADIDDTMENQDVVDDDNLEMSVAALSAYAEVLNNLITNYILPNNYELGFDEYFNMSENQFSLFDVDQDGNDELIIMYSTTYMAGMCGCVYDYDESAGQIHSELIEFPSLSFYDNGIIRADWSHNQGLAGEFWPYSLYQYQSKTDTYELVGMVDAWDKQFTETDFDGNAYPDDVDISGTGFIYYIMQDEYTTDNPVDGSVYKEWLAGFMDNANVLEIEFLDLTEENIQKVKNGTY